MKASFNTLYKISVNGFGYFGVYNSDYKFLTDETTHLVKYSAPSVNIRFVLLEVFMHWDQKH